MRKLVVLLLLLAPLGCRHNVNTNNPKVVAISALADASNTCLTLEDALTSANHVLEQIQSTEPEYYSHVKPLIQRVSLANDVAAHKIQAVKNGNASEWRSAFIALATSITPSDLTAFSVKNPSSQVIIGSSMAGIAAILQAIGGAR